MGSGSVSVVLLLLVLTILGVASDADAQSSGNANSLLDAWRKDPARHPNLPDVRFAGYRLGDALPAPKAGEVVADVKKLGAVGDGKADDTPAFAKALDAARKAGGGVIHIPAGTYRLTDALRLDADGIVLRGDGPTKSILSFDKSLTDILGDRKVGTSRQYAWMGGLIWIAPREGTWTNAGQLVDAYIEWWPKRDALARVISPAPQGSTTIDVDDASKLKPGDVVLLTYTDPSDNSFVKHMAGHPSMDRADFGNLSGDDWRWPVEVKSVDGSRITLAKPLRVEARREWNVRLVSPGAIVREVGVDNLGIRFPRHRVARHLQDVGFNGIYFNRAVNCWSRDVVIENADTGVGFSCTANSTASGINLRGQPMHHGTATRNNSHDNLIERFVIEAQPFHGINTEGMSSGNVWRAGVMKFGTFDSHRGMSFDSVRTDIEINASGRPGGANTAGPFLGRRIVHWNIRQTGGSTEWTNAPVYMPMGALVGVQGAKRFEGDKPFAMPPGDKGCVIVDERRAPSVPDLYVAQRARR